MNKAGRVIVQHKRLVLTHRVSRRKPIKDNYTVYDKYTYRINVCNKSKAMWNVVEGIP